MSHASRGDGVGIVGGGLLGLTVAHRLTARGIPVTVYERSHQLGGLAASTDLAGIPVDRFYHVVLPTDDRVRGLAAEVGLGDDAFRFRPTRAGFFHAGELASMASPMDLLRFPAISPLDRVRFAAFAARCQLRQSYDDLESVPLEDWLRRTCGDRLWDALWRPLLDSKFDGRFDDLPATYMWARSRRMSKTRDKSAKEVLGTIIGGYQRLVDALETSILAGGGRILTGTRVRSVASAGGRAMGVVLEDGLHPHEQVFTTQLRPNMGHLLPADLEAALGPDPCRYLGVVCLVARVRESVSPYYALNITDRRIPITTVVETTHVIDPDDVGGTLLYIPKYVSPDSPELERPSAEVRRAYVDHAREMLPRLRDEDILATQVARATVAEPVHVLGGSRAENLFPAPGLAAASSANVYPELVNGQAIIGLADRVADGLLSRITDHQRAAEAA